jgi:tellurium resistance protein TerD
MAYMSEEGYNKLLAELREMGGSVQTSGDNRSGAGEGDDEVITVDLSMVPAYIDRIAFTVTIYDAESRRQNFGMVSNSYIRVVNQANNEEIIRYDLGEDYSIETAIVVGELYRHNGEWKFNAVGSGFQGGLEALCANFGVNV